MEGLPLAGSLVAVASEPGHHFSKRPRRDIMLVAGVGVEGDAHAGEFVRHRYLARRQPRLPNLRQVHLIPSELFGSLRDAGYSVGPGDLGENVTTVGLELERLPLGTLLRLGNYAEVELTGLRTPCPLIDRFRRGLKNQMIRSTPADPKYRCGVMGVVKACGRIAPGERVVAVLPKPPWYLLPSL